MGELSTLLSALGGAVNNAASFQSQIADITAGIQATSQQAATWAANQLYNEKIYNQLTIVNPDGSVSYELAPFTQAEIETIAQTSYTAAIGAGASPKEAAEMATGAMAASVGSFFIPQEMLLSASSSFVQTLPLNIEPPTIPSISALSSLLPGEFNLSQVNDIPVVYEDLRPGMAGSLNVTPPMFLTNTLKCLTSVNMRFSSPVSVTFPPTSAPGLPNFIMSAAKGAVKSFLLFLEPFDKIVAVAKELLTTPPPQQLMKAMSALRELLMIIQNFPKVAMKKVVDFFMESFKMPDIGAALQSTLGLITDGQSTVTQAGQDTKDMISGAIVSSLSSVGGIIDFLKAPMNLAGTIASAVKGELMGQVGDSGGSESVSKAIGESMSWIESQIKMLLVMISIPVIFIALAIIAAMKIVKELVPMLIKLASGGLAAIFDEIGNAIGNAVLELFGMMGVDAGDYSDAYGYYLSVNSMVSCTMRQVTEVVKNLPMSVPGDITKIVEFTA